MISPLCVFRERVSSRGRSMGKEVVKEGVSYCVWG
jgi:hypothetical protein